MKKILTAFTTIILFASCQKEASFNTGNTGGSGSGGGTGGSGTGSGNTSGLLVRAVAVTGAETQTTLYSYDSQKRLETMTISGTSGGMPVNSYQKFIRDGAGRIVQVKQKLPDPVGVKSDTAVRNYYYPDASGMNFTYSFQTSSVDFGGFIIITTDSAVYNYTGGKMTSYHSYLGSGMLPGALQETKTDFGYDASDKVNTMKLFSKTTAPGGPLSLIADYTYTYSPTALTGIYASASGAQNMATHGLPNTTTAATTKMVTVSNATSPPMNVTITSTFVTGAGNKAVTAQSTAVITGQPTQNTRYTFFYQ